MWIKQRKSPRSQDRNYFDLCYLERYNRQTSLTFCLDSSRGIINWLQCLIKKSFVLSSTLLSLLDLTATFFHFPGNHKRFIERETTKSLSACAIAHLKPISDQIGHINILLSPRNCYDGEL